MIKLTISERLYALALLNQFKGNLEILVDAIKDAGELRITDEEWIKADKQVNSGVGEDGNPTTSWTWNDEKGGEKEIEITKSTKEYLIEKIKEVNDKGQFTFQDKAAITLSVKLKGK